MKPRHACAVVHASPQSRLSLPDLPSSFPRSQRLPRFPALVARGGSSPGTGGATRPVTARCWPALCCKTEPFSPGFGAGFSRSEMTNPFRFG